ncbi:MAG: ABC transporter ATP-binding protein [Chloroflexi bacterium]|nr:MAG: ABC transporter ATP-binding protein [Chloroflexota bacterium]
MSTTYGFGCQLPLNVTEAIAATTAALKQEGFGILTEIDVQATLKAKLDVEYRPYVILGACNPQLAYRGLQAEPELGLLLPCNVIVYDNGDGTSTVSIVDPLQMLSVANNPALQPVANEAKARLQRVIEHLDEPQSTQA